RLEQEQLFVACTLFRCVTLPAMIARTAVPATATMQREAIGLALVAVAVGAVLTVRALAVRTLILLRAVLRLGLRRALAAGDERRQPVDAIVIVLLKARLRPRLKILLLRRLLIVLRLRIMLRLLLRIERLLLLRRRRIRLAAHARLIVTVLVKGFV